jgi:hypothetical protein
LLFVRDVHLSGLVEIEVIDIYQQPELADQYGVFGAPTLVRLSPLPILLINGDLTRPDSILSSLGISPKPTASQHAV